MTAGSAAEGARENWLTPRRAAVAVFMLCMFLNLLDTSSVNVALLAIGTDFGVPVSQTSVINVGYLVTVAVLIPTSGWLGERFGTVRVILTSLVVFIAGALISATAQDLTMLTAGRVIQGVGGGGIAPLATSLLYRNFAPAERLRIGVMTSIPVAFAPALGPLLGGLFVQFASWRGIFLLNLPLSVVALVIAWRFALEPEERSSRRLDVAGALLTVLGFGGIAFALNALSRGDAGPLTLLVLGAAIVVLAALVTLELRLGARAFLDIALLKSRVYARCVLMMSVNYLPFTGFGFALPVLLQSAMGLDPLIAGAIAMCQAAGPVIGGRVGQRVLMRFGAKRTFLVAQLAMVICLGVTVAGFVTGWVVLAAVAAASYGAGGFITTLTAQTVGFSSVPQRNMGDASSLLGASRQLAAVG
ncbi:MAG TPA: MFS transporter, partial [Microbacterium sp.]|nr:MFS transporter [Microbacterium sp.]